MSAASLLQRIWGAEGFQKNTEISFLLCSLCDCTHLGVQDGAAQEGQTGIYFLKINGWAGEWLWWALAPEMGARPVIELTLGQDRPAESALALLVALNGSGHSLCLSCLVSLYVLLGRWHGSGGRHIVFPQC